MFFSSLHENFFCVESLFCAKCYAKSCVASDANGQWEGIPY